MQGGRFATFVLPAVVVVGLTPAAPAVAAPGAASTATVHSPAMPLNVRSGPARWHPLTGRIPHGATVTPVCHTDGQAATGTVRRTRTWVRLATGGYVSDAYLRRGALPARCT